jgi:hypothetical protein
MSVIWNIFGPWIVVAVLLLILALSLYGILRLARPPAGQRRDSAAPLHDPRERDRQPRALPAESRRSAHARADRTRRAEDAQRTPEAGETLPEYSDQMEADVRRLLGEEDEHTP